MLNFADHADHRRIGLLLDAAADPAEAQRLQRLELAFVPANRTLGLFDSSVAGFASAAGLASSAFSSFLASPSATSGLAVSSTLAASSAAGLASVTAGVASSAFAGVATGVSVAAAAVLGVAVAAGVSAFAARTGGARRRQPNHFPKRN